MSERAYMLGEMVVEHISYSVKCACCWFFFVI